MGDVDDILCDSVEEETPVWCPTEEEQELDEHDMELVDVLADLMC